MITVVDNRYNFALSCNQMYGIAKFTKLINVNISYPIFLIRSLPSSHSLLLLSLWQILRVCVCLCALIPLPCGLRESWSVQGMSSLWPTGFMWPRMAMNAAQHKIVNLLKTFSLLISFHQCLCIYVWPKTALLLPGWPRDAKRLETPTRPIMVVQYFELVIVTTWVCDLYLTNETWGDLMRGFQEWVGLGFFFLFLIVIHVNGCYFVTI